MIIRTDIEQGSALWFEARAGVVTASEAHNLVTPEFKLREGEMVKTYVAQKIAEKWGGPMLDFSSFCAEQGELVEQEVRPWLEMEMGCEIKQAGLCLTDDGKAGCSPDGIVGEEGIEIKSPQPINHVKWLLAGSLPKDHAAQVDWSMFVTGFKTWRFVSYRRNFPPLILVIKRDEEIQKVLRMALEIFLEKFDAGLTRLKALAPEIGVK